MENGIPDGFAEEMRALLGAEQAQALLQALETPAVTGVRINPAKICVVDDEPAVTGVRINPAKGCVVDGEPVAWCRLGRIPAERPQFTLMPEWHAGCFYVQEPASMVIATVIERLAERIGRRDLLYLDLCAAPGGKTTAALSALPQEAFVVANEYVPARAKILVENLTKWGCPNVAVTCGDTAAYSKLHGLFDIVAVDAPCSGEGMMRKDEEARRQWSPSLVRNCAGLQRTILANAWDALKPGGYLIYSTCTFNRTEDEDMLRYAVEEFGAESVDTGIAGEFGIHTSLDPELYALRFMPHITSGEGLFLGVLRKPAGADEAPRKAKEKEKKRGNKPCTPPAEICRLLQAGGGYSYRQAPSGAWYAVPAAHSRLVSLLEEHGKLLYAGVRLGETKGKNFVPDTALALSTALAPGAFPEVDVEKQTALCYLRREALTLPPETPAGYVIIRYEGQRLGFVKNLGNRANNLYPASWRIRFL